MLRKGLLHLLALIRAHNAVVNKNRMEPVSDSLVHEFRGHGRVNSTADSTENLALFSNQSADFVDLLVNKSCHCPVLLGATDAHGEVLQELYSIWGVFSTLTECNQFLMIYLHLRVTSGCS